MYRFRHQKRFIAVGGILLGLTALLTLIFWMIPNAEKKATKSVRTFYNHEQEGNFSKSWEMFHPLMQERFSKGHYIQDRAHVFLNHFGVETFDYKVGKVEEKENWKMTKDVEPLNRVYRVPVTLTYKGKYGNFDIIQDVYAIEVDNEWKILWDYNK